MSETCENCVDEPLEPAPAAPRIYARHPGKLPKHVRDGAALVDGVEILKKALRTDPAGATAPGAKALQLAELAVTGYAAFRALRARWTKPVWSWSVEQAKDLVAACALPTTPATNTPSELRAVGLVQRARAVAMFLLANDPEMRTPNLPSPVKEECRDGRHAMRDRLGQEWIATAGELDPPHRSVNVQATDFVERRSGPFTFAAGPAGKKFTTDVRYILEGPEAAPIVVLLHGHSSKLEELEQVVPLLRDHFRVLVFDQPGGAGFTRGDLPPAPTKTSRGPAIALLTDFVAAFIAHLRDKKELRAQSPVSFAGGSLGGHLAMRLNARHGAIPGAKRYAAWSPGSAWHFPKDHEADPDNSFMSLGWGKPSERMSRKIEDEEKYGWSDYMKLATTTLKIFGQPILLQQAEHWYWDHWYPEVRKAMIDECYEARREIFCAYFRIMHWQLAWEQLVFSHHGLPGQQGVQPYQAYKAPLLLMAGCNDNIFPERLATGTHDLVLRMQSEGMKNVFWRGFCCSGHSLHNERPRELADVLTRWFNDGEVA